MPLPVYMEGPAFMPVGPTDLKGWVSYLKSVLGPVLAAYNSTQSDVEAVLSVPGIDSAHDQMAVLPLVQGGNQLDLRTRTAPALSLEPLLKTTNWDPATFIPGLVDAVKWNDQLIGVPYMYSPMAIWVDIADWQALGIPLPSPQWTSQQFTSTCALLHAALGRSKSVLGRGLYRFPAPQVWTGWVWGHGGRLVDPDGRIVLTDAGARSGVGALANAIRAAVPDMCAQTGEMGFTYGGHWASTPAVGSTKVGLAAYPVMPFGRAVPTEVWGLGIPAGYPHANLAAAFLFWLSGPGGQAEMVAAGYPTVLAHGSLGSAQWVTSTPPGVDLGGLDPPASALRPIPWQVQLLSGLLELAIWQSLDAVSDEELAQLLFNTEQECNACLALPAEQQQTYLGQKLQPFFRPGVGKTPQASSGSVSCFLPAFSLPSRYATATLGLAAAKVQSHVSRESSDVGPP